MSDVSNSTEIRASGQGDELSLAGYAAVHNQLSSDLGGFRERLCANCFRDSLVAGEDTKCLRDHNPVVLLGRVKNGSLRLSEDAKGLKFRVTLPDTSTARDTYALVKNGTLSDCSFAFVVDQETWDEEDDPDDKSKRISVRSIQSIKHCLDVSFVTAPAYPGTELVTAPSLNSMPRSMDQLWPEGLPASFSPEMRSRIVRRASQRIKSVSSTERLANFIIGL